MFLILNENGKFQVSVMIFFIFESMCHSLVYEHFRSFILSDPYTCKSKYLILLMGFSVPRDFAINGHLCAKNCSKSSVIFIVNSFNLYNNHRGWLQLSSLFDSCLWRRQE